MNECKQLIEKNVDIVADLDKKIYYYFLYRIETQTTFFRVITAISIDNRPELFIFSLNGEKI